MATAIQQEIKINKLEYFEFETHPENAAVRDTVTGVVKILCFGEHEKQQGKAIVNAANNFDAMIELLNKISKWETPVTGKFWDRERKKPMSYEAAFGSNGVRDYFKQMAKEVLKSIK